MPRPLEEQSPEELIEYIRSLRRESQKHRERAEGVNDAFGKLSPAEQQGMLALVKSFGEDRNLGAKRFKELATTILGEDDMTTQNPAAQPQYPAPQAQQAQQQAASLFGQPAAAPAPADPMAQIAAMMQQQTEVIQGLKSELDGMKAEAEKQQRASEEEYWLGQAEKLGYDRNDTVKTNQLFQAAQAVGGDLTKAHRLLGLLEEQTPAQDPAAAAAAAAQAQAPAQTQAVQQLPSVAEQIQQQRAQQFQQQAPVQQGNFVPTAGSMGVATAPPAGSEAMPVTNMKEAHAKAEAMIAELSAQG